MVIFDRGDRWISLGHGLFQYNKDTATKYFSLPPRVNVEKIQICSSLSGTLDIIAVLSSKKYIPKRVEARVQVIIELCKLLKRYEEKPFGIALRYDVFLFHIRRHCCRHTPGSYV